MERGSSIARWLFLGVAVFLFMQYGWPMISGGSGPSERQPLGARDDVGPQGQRPEEQRCTIETERFRAVLSTRGASVVSAAMLDRKYAAAVDETDTPIELVTTSVESRAPLRSDLRAPGVADAEQLVPSNDLDWELVASDGGSCTFRYADATVELTKIVERSPRPFELSVKLSAKNLADGPRSYRVAVEQTAWRTKKETEGSLGRQSEWLTEVVLHTAGETKRLHPDAFDPGDFGGEGFTPEAWLRLPGAGVFAAVSSTYFSSMIAHKGGPAPPAVEAQIEERWNEARFPKKSDDPSFGHVYRARLAYPVAQLAPGDSESYEQLAFFGPKEREVLAGVGGVGDDSLGASALIDLGMFGAIGKILIGYVYWLFKHVGSWGWAICLLTITVKIAVFPLSFSQLKSTVAMRRIKPQMDEINARYKDDAAQRGLALQELWRKEGVGNPVIGCIPMLLQMPVWFSLYSALQTAVELYHVPFGPLIPDLSAPDPYHVIPFVLGASSFVQQRIMPMQGDPMQQKMMLYMMPIIFTVMMFFLPAGLGVYMLTNSWLGIGQQLLVERWIKTKLKPAASIEVRAVSKDSDKPEEAPVAPIGKGKARARG
jgi:YidC/Oxa1 family membrane protein insertase